MARKRAKNKKEIRIKTKRKVVKRVETQLAEPEKKKLGYVFDNVPSERAFFVADGSQISSLHELALALEQMEEHTFSFHSNEQKNDFSNWIKDVMGETKLADALLKTKGKEETQIKILKHIIEKLK